MIERISERQRERERNPSRAALEQQENKAGRVGEWESEQEPKCFRFSGHCTAYCFELQLLA